MTRRCAPGHPATGPWLLAGPGPAPPPPHGGDDPLPAAVLLDRDGTPVADVPCDGDPARVVLMPTAREAVDAVRAAGIVTNQSGVAGRLLTRRHVETARRRIEEPLGPFAVRAVCPHGPSDGCRCRKPAPGLVPAACRRLGVPPGHTAVIGGIGADTQAARAAGARGVLVPTAAPRPEEIAAADATAGDLLGAVRLPPNPAPAFLPAGEAR